MGDTAKRAASRGWQVEQTGADGAAKAYAADVRNKTATRNNFHNTRSALAVYYTEMHRLAIIVVLIGKLAAQSRVPAAIQAPADQVLLLTLRGKGDQIYECQNNANVYAWKLKAPDAKLFKGAGEIAGRHYAGPTWESNDGSRVTGKLKASVPAPDALSIAWLLVTAASHEGAGVMSKVQTIQRLETKGGLAPSTVCDATDEHKEARVGYEATYNFYGSETDR